MSHPGALTRRRGFLVPPILPRVHTMADSTPKPLLDQVHAALKQEIGEDAKAVAARLRGEFDSGTVDLKGQAATNYFQQTWTQGKGLRDPAEIDRLGPEKWWDTYFEHVGVNATPLTKQIFFTAIEAGIDYVQALQYATVLGSAPPDPFAGQPPDQQPFAGTPPAQQPMGMTPPEQMAPPPAPPQPMPPEPPPGVV